MWTAEKLYPAPVHGYSCIHASHGRIYLGFGDVFMWCAGEVVGLDPRPYKDFPKGKSALIKWDANDRVVPPEPVSISGTKLLPSLWNKDGLYAWRMDLDPPPPSDDASPSATPAACA